MLRFIFNSTENPNMTNFTQSDLTEAIHKALVDIGCHVPTIYDTQDAYITWVRATHPQTPALFPTTVSQLPESRLRNLVVRYLQQAEGNKTPSALDAISNLSSISPTLPNPTGELVPPQQEQKVPPQQEPTSTVEETAETTSEESTSPAIEFKVVLADSNGEIVSGNNLNLEEDYTFIADIYINGKSAGDEVELVEAPQFSATISGLPEAEALLEFEDSLSGTLVFVHDTLPEGQDLDASVTLSGSALLKGTDEDIVVNMNQEFKLS